MRRTNIDVPHQFSSQQLQVHIIPTDVAIDRQMEAVERAAVFVSAIEREQHDMTKRLQCFSLRDALYGGLGEPGRVSPHFVNEFTRYSQLDTAEVNSIVDLVTNVILMRLNAPQLTAYNHLLNGGAPAALAILEGWPGTGKTTCLVLFVYAVALMGFKAFYVAEAYAAVQAATASLHKYAATRPAGGIEHLHIRLLHSTAGGLLDPLSSAS